MSKFPIWMGNTDSSNESGDFSVTSFEDSGHAGQVAIWLGAPFEYDTFYLSPEMAMHFADALREVAKAVLDAQEPVKTTKTVTIKRMVNRQLVTHDIEVPINKEVSE